MICQCPSMQKKNFSDGKKDGRLCRKAIAHPPLPLLKVYDHEMYPNFHMLPSICAKIPATSCQCGRSGSVLKRLHTFLRTSMGPPRLSALALLHVNHDVNIDIEIAIDIFARKKERDLEFGNICDTLIRH